MRRKIISSILCLSLLSSAMPIFANDTCDTCDRVFDESLSRDIVVEGEDIDGNAITITIEDNSYLEYSKSAIGNMSINSKPEHDLGYIWYLNFKVKNSQIIAGSKTWNAATKAKVGKAIAKRIAEKVGYKFLPGVNILVTVLDAMATVNLVAGNEGFHVTGKLEYDRYYYHKDGYFVYGWKIHNLNVETY